MPNRKPYPTDVSDEEWAFVAPYLALVREDAPQRHHDLGRVFDALRWIVRAGVPWRMLPHDFPPWEAVYQQAQRWNAAGVFEAMVHDLRELLRLAQGRAPDPSAAVLDNSTLRSTPESGRRGGYGGAERKKGSKVHLAVDTLGHLLALRLTLAGEQDCAQVGELAEAVREATGESVELAYVDRGYTGEEPAREVRKRGMRLEVVKHPGAKRASCCCRVGGWWSAPSRGRRASVGWKDYERLPQTLRGCTSSPSPASGSAEPSSRSGRVHNTL